ncbi:MAG: thioredoxin family protein [Leptonema sp. (in: bacteria)]
MNKINFFIFLIFFNTLWSEPIWIHNDFSKALQSAKKIDKPILVDLFSKNCYYCFVLEKEVYHSKEFTEWHQKFIFLRVDGDRFPELIEKFQIDGYPTTIFLDTNGVEIGRIEGYLPKFDFLKKISIFYKNKDLLKNLEEKIKRDPKNYYNYFQLAIYYDKQKNLTKSEEYLLKSLLNLSSEDKNYYQNKKNILYNLAVQNTKLENYQKAYSYWNAFISWINSEDLDLPYARFYRAYMFLKYNKNLNQEEKNQIVKDLRYALEKLPNSYEKEEAKKILFDLSK